MTVPNEDEALMAKLREKYARPGNGMPLVRSGRA
jgi:hypothetical protein